MSKLDDRLTYLRRVQGARKRRPGGAEITLFISHQPTPGDGSAIAVELLSYDAHAIELVGAIGELIMRLERLALDVKNPDAARAKAAALRAAYQQIFDVTGESGPMQ